MSIRSLVTLAVAAALSSLACTVVDPLYCDDDVLCKDPERPFCDVTGQYPASEGVARTCIPDPNADAGSDDGADGGDAEDDGSDGAEPDAGVPSILRTGTVAITENTITNPPADPKDPPMSGAVVSMSFIDRSRATVPPVEGFEDPIEGCQVFVYDMTAGDFEPAGVDEGVITVAGTANGDFDCAFRADFGKYLCQSVDPGSAGGVPGNADNASFDTGEIAALVGVAGSLDEAAVVGSQLFLTGFDVSALDGKFFGVLARPANQSFIFAIPGPRPVDLRAPPTATYATFIGAGPIPNEGGFYNFLATSEVVVYSAGSKLVPVFGGTYTPEGEGFELLSAPGDRIFLPHDIPTNLPAEFPVRFACQEGGCGTPGAGGEMTALIVTGRTTDRPLPSPSEDPTGTQMPSPMARYATFTCIYEVSDEQNEARIPAEALDVILGTDPTRIETTVLRAQAVPDATSDSAAAAISLFIGHSLTGFTTVEAPPKLARPKQ